MPQVIENASTKNNVELAQVNPGQFEKVEVAVVGLGAELAVQVQIVRLLLAIHGCHSGAAALGFETEPAVPGADIEHALASEIGWDGKAGPAFALPFQAHVAVDQCPIGQLEAVRSEERSGGE